MAENFLRVERLPKRCVFLPRHPMTRPGLTSSCRLRQSYRVNGDNWQPLRDICRWYDKDSLIKRDTVHRVAPPRDKTPVPPQLLPDLAGQAVLVPVAALDQDLTNHVYRPAPA